MPLISESYRAQQQKLHESGHYGTIAEHYAPMIGKVMDKLQVAHLLDYGCGSNLSLLKTLKVDHKFKYQAYDPGVEKYSAPPVPAEMVVCIDVLEHIEENSIDDVLDHLETLTEAVGVFTVCTVPAFKTLPDGRNAHLLQRPPEWWLPRLMCRFELQTYQMTDATGFFVIVNAIPRNIEGLNGDKL